MLRTSKAAEAATDAFPTLTRTLHTATQAASQMLRDHSQSTPRSNFGAIFARMPPSSANFGLKFSKFGELWADADRVWPQIGQTYRPTRHHFSRNVEQCCLGTPIYKPVWWGVSFECLFAASAGSYRCLFFLRALAVLDLCLLCLVAPCTPSSIFSLSRAEGRQGVRADGAMLANRRGPPRTAGRHPPAAKRAAVLRRVLGESHVGIGPPKVPTVLSFLGCGGCGPGLYPGPPPLP